MMKHTCALSLAAVALLSACGGKTIPLATENNTAVGCVDVLQVSPASTPVAILGGVRECIGQGAYGKAAALGLLSNTYGAYDARRVADKSAHQAVLILQMGMANGLTPEQRQAYKLEWSAFAVPDSQQKQAFCTDMARMKEPRYYPRYMINHGAAAYSRALGNKHIASADLVPYDPETVWNDVRTNYLKCR